MSTAPKEVTDIALRTGGGELAQAALSIQDLIAQKHVISQCMKELMKNDEHYGLIPGAKKPSLWKPGADLIGFMFRLEADYIDEEVIHEPGYIYYRVKCVLTHIPTGKRVGSGVGSCNSREEKYRRTAAKKCPRCGKETIIKGKAEYGGGWLCFEKKGGCKAKWPDGADEIEQQDTAPADPSDLDNTICKMAHKRARIDAILTATAASDFFTQDMEDLATKVVEYTPPAPKEDARPKANTAAAAAQSSQTARDFAPPATQTASATTTPVKSATGPAAGGTASHVVAKAPRANTIKHDGTFASHKQVALLHILKSKIGGMTDKCDCYDADGKRINPIRKMCLYHTQLAAFKDCDSRPIRTSKDLSEDQISNLISRYEAKIKQQEGRAAEGLDTGAVGVEPAVKCGGQHAFCSDVCHERGKHVDDDPFVEVRGAIDTKDDPEACLTELCEIFRCPTVDDIPKHEAPHALALVLAYGTTEYPEVLARVRP